jgi:hypothetical protein
MDENPDGKRVIENQVAEALTKVRQAIAERVTIQFETSYEPPETGASFWGKAEIELIGAYAKDGTIVVLSWVKDWQFPEQAMEEFWNMLGQRVQEDLVKKIPDLKWFSLEAYFFDSLEDLEQAAFQGGEIS